VVVSFSHGAAKKPTGREWKRRYPRYRIDLPLKARVLGANGYNEVQGRSGDLGEGGLGAIFVSEISQGEVVALEMHLPAGNLLQVRGIVRYRKGLLHGLEFLGLTEEQHQTILQLCGAASEIE
jgi:hypothetical protein